MSKRNREFRTTRLAPDACLDCGKRIDSASDAQSDAKPSPGDITICLGCGHVMAFSRRMRLRPLTDAEMVEIAGDRNVIEIQNALGALWKAHPESRTK